MNYLINIAVSLLVSTLTFLGAFNYLPLGTFDTPNFGNASITTILGTDTLSSSRAVINTNFANLNSDKLSISDFVATTTLTTLAEVGTLTTGTWNADTITAAYGGTGSTTLAHFNILLGSTTNPVGIVQGHGTSGQFLVSNGAGAAPTWQTKTADEAANYTWTGVHTFNNAANIFLALTEFGALKASSTTAKPLTLNGVAYAFPSSQGASSTALMTDGSGNLSWNDTNPKVLYHDGTTTSTSGTATSTVTVTVPAGTMGANDSLMVEMRVLRSGSAVGNSADILIGDGSATSTLISVSGNTAAYLLTSDFFNNNSVSSQFYYSRALIPTTESWYQGTFALNTGNQFYIAFRVASTNGSDVLNIKGIKVILTKKP